MLTFNEEIFQFFIGDKNVMPGASEGLERYWLEILSANVKREVDVEDLTFHFLALKIMIDRGLV